MMKKTPLILLCLSWAADLLAQRSHEIQIQAGLSVNHGVSFYDFHEGGGLKRHNFEFDQKYSMSFVSLSWHYPVNSHVSAGLFFNRSLNATLRLLEAESLFLDAGNPGVRQVSPYFLGLTELTSESKELGIECRVTAVRFGRFNAYAVFGPTLQRISILDDPDNIVEAGHKDLRNDLLSTYRVAEDVLAVGFGLGISCLLKSGLRLRIIEVRGKYQVNSLMLSASNSIEVKTGISYQFLRRK